MFRSSLRRCATQARTATTAALFSQTRAALPVARCQALTTRLPIASINKIASFRAYSSEAAAEQTQSAAADVEPEVRFAELEGVDQSLIRTIIQDMGYETMTPVQAKTIKPALKGTDIVAQAKTGTGKTMAFLLPLLQRMITEDPSLAGKNARRQARSDDIRGIVLSPTRELAEQIAMEARRLCQNTGLVVQCAVGGTDKRGMLNQTRRQGCHLLVATPGRLNDVLQDTSSGIDAPNLAALVLDEADRMLDTGFERELNEIVNQLPRPEEKVRQTMLVSATIPDSVIRLARSMVRADDFEFVQTIPENESLTHDKVPQHIVPVASWTQVFPTLFELMDREHKKSLEDPNELPFKAIVYLNTTALVELGGELGYQMRQNARNDGKPFLASYVLQSKMGQNQRQRAADRFREAKSGVLFSSDVTARGMDFPNVTHVIQIDTPRDRESYIHRLGRTGRQNKEGQGWLILPHSSVRVARKMLQGLPIAQNSSLESAETDVEGGESTPYHESTKALFSVIPRDLLSQTYTSMFGLATDKVETAEDVNKWTKHGWGWDTPPYVSSMWVNKMGLSRASGMNIKERDSFSGGDRGGDRGGYGGDRRGGDRGGRSSRDQRSSDPFDSMAANVRRDDFGRGGNRTGGYGGGSRGFGGGRDNNGGRGRTGGRGGSGYGGRGSSRSSF
ncbi:putative dead-box precursor cyt-19 [Fusarium sporotrichioides]|uniref:ATP-dependent RNA helicase n=1 Tax=Fusarium sporotrichioides TaxID=5514 RepID=A0A395SM47_FUSSP|nr:putative dead-box precursor cyt-19 [Fusarium sporotrichioides]